MIRPIIRPVLPGKNLLRGFLMLTALMLLSGCAAQIVGRAQRAIDAAQNTADTVAASVIFCDSV